MKSPRISTHNGETLDDHNGKPDSPRRVAEEDEVLFFKQPHTLTALLLAGIVLVYFAFYHTRAEENSAYNIKMGFFAMILVFLFFSMQQMRDGLFVRPHPAFWRIVMGCAVLYLLGCVYMLFQTADDARRLFSFIDPALGVPLPERSYAEDCRIFTPENPESQYKNVMGTVYDEFLIAHLLGWFGKSLILRDAYLSWFISILFEVLEVSLEHILPNFKECWWDHIILDVLVCNGIGIYLGHLVLKYLEVKEYDWGGRTNAGKKRGRSVSNAKRMVLQFTPYNWTKFNWSIFESPKRFFAVIAFIALESIVELNCFFLKFVLWHPPPHPLVTARLFLIFLFALPATREYYEWITNPNCKRIGPMAWLAVAITGTEVLIWVKFSKGQFDHVVSHPPAVVWSWAVFLIGLFSWAVFYFYYYKPRKQRQLQEQKKQE